MRLSRVLTFLICSSALAGFAQEDSLATDLPAEASLTLENPSASRAWSVSVVSENMANARELNELGSEAPVRSMNGVGLGYQVSKSTAFELRPRFEYASNHERLSGRARQGRDSAGEMAAFLVRATHASTAALGSSKPINLDFQYYAPTDRAALLNRENGLLRLDSFTEWMLSPRWSVGGLVSARVLLNGKENPNEARGSDADYYRLMLAPSLIYNMSDKASSYYIYYADLASQEAQRGIWRADAINGAYHEVGLTWKLGPVLFNPFVISSASHNDATASLLTSESRVFSFETLDYGLNVIAKF